MVPSLTLYDLPFPPKWDSVCPKIREWPSPQRVIRYTSCLVLGRVFRDGVSNGAISGYIKSKLVAGRLLG